MDADSNGDRAVGCRSGRRAGWRKAPSALSIALATTRFIWTSGSSRSLEAGFAPEARPKSDPPAHYLVNANSFGNNANASGYKVMGYPGGGPNDAPVMYPYSFSYRRKLAKERTKKGYLP